MRAMFHSGWATILDGTVVCALAQLDIAHGQLKIDNRENNTQRLEADELFPGCWNGRVPSNNNQNRNSGNNNNNHGGRFRSGFPGNGGYRSQPEAGANSIQVSSDWSLPDFRKPPPLISKQLTIENNPIVAETGSKQSSRETDSSATINLNNITTKNSFRADIADFVEEIRSEVRGNDGNDPSQAVVYQSCPHISMSIADIKVQALLDTGSEISAVSEDFLQSVGKSKTFRCVVGLMFTTNTRCKQESHNCKTTGASHSGHGQVPGLNQQILL